ncbi:hypothetical protein [Leeia sp.]|uniref:hypothetical protein n=1 Tax=Leeia sp. TaxID=2884678 RepID=UPI0035B24A0E
MNTYGKTTTMMPVSGRIPEDLYQWLSTSTFEGATTMSDKLRAGLTQLKHQQEGDADYGSALERQKALAETLRRQLARLEPAQGHSEVLATLLEHVPSLMAALASAQVLDLKDAQRLEDQLIQRSMQLLENLLRQAVTRQARAYDPDVVTRRITPILELATIIQQQGIHTTEGN